MAKYLRDDLQQILRTILDFRPFAPLPVLIPAPHYKGFHKTLLKVWFLYVYQNKSHIEYYNFFPHCKDHFAIADAIEPNQVPFAANFLKEIALLQW